jgi:hypothetical protein
MSGQLDTKPATLDHFATPRSITTIAAGLRERIEQVSCEIR